MKKLEELRLAAGLSQETLAEAMGRSQAYISRMENGLHAFTVDYAADMAVCSGRTIIDVVRAARADGLPLSEGSAIALADPSALGALDQYVTSRGPVKRPFQAGR